jgi:hypothetical protein
MRTFLLGLDLELTEMEVEYVINKSKREGININYPEFQTMYQIILQEALQVCALDKSISPCFNSASVAVCGRWPTLLIMIYNLIVATDVELYLSHELAKRDREHTYINNHQLRHLQNGRYIIDVLVNIVVYWKKKSWLMC